ncbi:hypothetical protein ACJMK2_021219 [Sinanodonta woodiana]|uniref:Uncharacterized protein n=1 Tax=Sinanodonta woodiana TaxID=1069815 RepID=A0ABD3U4J1_SINWO
MIGRLVQVVREMKIWQNGSMDLVTSVYHPGFVDMFFNYSHKCELSTNTTSGAVDLFTESQEPIRLISFQELLDALQMGEIVNFSSMIFLCQGFAPHPFEILGGAIREFDSYEESGGQVITSTVQVTASYDKDDNQDYANIMNLRVYDNTLVVVSLTEATGADMELKSQIEYNCEFQTDMPGGSAVFYRA